MEVRSHVIARFFKIILPSTVTQHKLRIPTKFVDKYGDELSNVVKLIDLVNATWCVKLEKTENTLWFNDGWKKFVDDHSIGCFYFLLFEYIGNSSFNVHIFDLTATEVDYPTSNCNFGGDENVTTEDNSDDDSVRIIDSFVANAKRDGIIRHGSERVDLRTTEVDSPTNNCNLEGDDNITMEDNSDDDSVQIIDSFVAKEDGRRHGSERVEMEESSDDDSVRVIASSATSKPESKRELRHEIPSFRVSLKPYNVFQMLPLYVPATIVTYLPSFPHHFELHDSDGKKWLLHVCRRKNGRIYFSCSGWRRVVEEKGLELGDTCVFELINVNKWMLKVFRNETMSSVN